MRLKQWMFPAEPRFFRGQRWVNIVLRTLHLVGIAGLGGGFLYAAERPEWRPFLDLTVWSGLGLSLIAVWNSGIWLIQLRGQAVVVKVLLLSIIPYFPELQGLLFVTVIVISGLISHAPAAVRYHSLYHGRRIGLY
ncbi:MAG: hypothetical protein KDI63_10245 [Gammaproteobacteria bacterium]|nr:hypothetical protein [Gammaproteobacteria bacterium]